MQVISRSSGRSVIAAAAYRAGERLYDARADKTHDYSRRRGVEHKEILLPADAPAWCAHIDREGLWNRVESVEKRKDSQTARELRVMLPREIGPQARVEVLREYLKKSFVSKGMIADVAWHNTTASDGQDQPHAHILLTMRPLTDGGFGPKSRHEWVVDPEGRKHPDGRPVMVVSNKDSWNCPDYFERCREDWENIANAALARVGSEERIDRRSLLARGLLRLPEPALRLAWYMKDLYGCMKDRFGQFQMARHYRAVESAASSAFVKMGVDPVAPAERLRTTNRFFGWFERQIDRLQPAPKAPARDPNQDLERGR